jgi:hypothetical protein
MSVSGLPEYRDWSVAAVRLLQGVVYADDLRTWEIVLSSQQPLTNHFARLGLVLVVDESEGLAYLRQMADDELPDGYEQLPKLFRRTPLGYEATLLCVLLREELRRFDEEDVHNERCVVETGQLFDQWKAFFPAQQDEVQLHRGLSTALHKLEALGFLHKFADEPEAWEIRRILKARLPVSELENLKGQLQEAARRRIKEPTSGDSDG